MDEKDEATWAKLHVGNPRWSKSKRGWRLLVGTDDGVDRRLRVVIYHHSGAQMSFPAYSRVFIPYEIRNRPAYLVVDQFDPILKMFVAVVFPQWSTLDEQGRSIVPLLWKAAKRKIEKWVGFRWEVLSDGPIVR